MLIPTEAALKDLTALKKVPLTTAWSRLEGRPRISNFDRALKVEVRDALWMLTKQWQMGEFEGEDAGSPVVAKLCTATSELDKYQAHNNKVQGFDKDVPFEAKVEQRPLPFSVFGQELSLDLRIIMGRRWMQLLKKEGLWVPTKQFFLDHYGFAKPDPTLKTDAAICAHPEVWQQFSAVVGRMMDGAQFYFDLKSNKLPHYFDLADFPLAGDHSKFENAEKEFKEWFEDLFYQPNDPVNDAWEPARLEYQFAISANDGTGEKVMHADEYYHGHLDWYNLDVDKQTKTLGDVADAPPVVPPQKKTQSVIPAPVLFEGMPNTRWWAFEDAKTNFSYIKPDTTDLPKLLMIEFGLIYANDWYLIPYKLPVASLTKIKGLTLTNSFGENFWIEAAGKGDDMDWARWNMFSMKVDSNTPQAADTDLLLLPTVAKIQEGKPYEEVMFVRDEMANMVWGIETIVPLPGGSGKSGFEAAAEYHRYLQKLITDSVFVAPPPPPIKDGEEEAKIRYEIMNAIPENWIPFIPAHVSESNREVQLQRGAMPRILEGNPDKPAKVRPRTALLQEGLTDKKPYF
ncbi:MAG TPA: hypothetical protein VM843_03040, partial [Flavisolibacter sp.]|nr:hypothetical protein [Flavisolibacter sp.]